MIKSEGNIGQIGQLIQGQVGQLMQNIKMEKDLVEHVITDHSYTEPPSKKIKMEDRKEVSFKKTEQKDVNGWLKNSVYFSVHCGFSRVKDSVD